MKYESVIIGHICRDTNTDHLGNVENRCGGAVLFSSAAAFGLGHRVMAITKLKREDRCWLREFRLPKSDIIAIDAEKSTIMENTYFTADKEKRRSVCAVQGDGFSISDVPETDSEIYHLAGLTVGDFNGEMLVELSKRGKLAVDVQGFLRRVTGDGTMVLEDWADKEKYLPYITYLKTDALEAKVMTGSEDRAEAAKILYNLGAKEVIITHNTEVLCYDGKEIYTCPIRARSKVGRTGRGDTTFAAYTTERIAKPIYDALLYATATVSLKMEKAGSFTGTRADVEEYLRRFY